MNRAQTKQRCQVYTKQKSLGRPERTPATSASAVGTKRGGTRHLTAPDAPWVTKSLTATPRNHNMCQLPRRTLFLSPPVSSATDNLLSRDTSQSLFPSQPVWRQPASQSPQQPLASSVNFQGLAYASNFPTAPDHGTWANSWVSG